jgi:hypothetical protein
MSVSNSKGVASVSTSDSKYLAPSTWSDVALFCHAKYNEGNKGEAAAVVEDVVQCNKGQATIDIAGSYDTG